MDPRMAREFALSIQAILERRRNRTADNLEA
jgi:hypothetical protein